MKKRFLYLLISGLFLFAAKASYAQDYQTAVGLKFGGYENGFSIKYFSTKDVSLEGIIGIRSQGIVFTGLYELNKPAFNFADLKLYYGVGAHVGSIGNKVYQGIGSATYTNNTLLLGADAVVGLEYLIPKSPIAVSLDLDPRLEIASGPFLDLAIGLGIKYAF